jgi:hypothetical protein
MVWLMASAEQRNIPHGAYRDGVEVLPPYDFPPRVRVYRVDRW